MTTSTGIELIAAERDRQITDERWDARHDDRHKNGSMATAASAYAYPDRSLTNVWDDDENRYEQVPEDWPWEPRFWKPTPNDRIRELVKAGALIAAEIDRLQRASVPARDNQ